MKIITLCGSTRFRQAYRDAEWQGMVDGNIIISIGFHPTIPDHPGEALGCAERFDELHRRKIDLAHEILVLNVGGHIGESTRDEILYAMSKGKPVRYLEKIF